MRNSVSLFHSLSAARADREKRAQWPRIVTISYGPFSQIKCFISLHTHTHTLIRLPLGQVFSDPVPGITSLIWLMSKSSLYRTIIPKKKKKIFNMTPTPAQRSCYSIHKTMMMTINLVICTCLKHIKSTRKLFLFG